MGQHPQSRRDFLRTSTLLVVGGATAGVVEARAATTPVRKDLGSLKIDSPDILALAAAYEVMKKLHKDHPHNWEVQANIHGFPPQTPMPDEMFKQVWGTCEHGSWWFFPWHRAYIHFFERIVRKYSKNQDFALPYWHWDSTTSNQRKLHLAFLNGGPLYIDKRSKAANNAREFLNAARIAKGKSRAMRETVFEGGAGFGGPKRKNPTHRSRPHGLLESSPHDFIHGKTGGITGYMTYPNYAARDPLFWVHHSNIDRLWVEWRRKGNQDPVDKDWSKQTFYFFNEDEKVVPVTVKDLLKMKSLNYVYDMYPDDPPVLAGEVEEMKEAATLAQSKDGTKELKSEPLSLTIPLGDKAIAFFKMLAGGEDKEKTAYVQLTIHGVRFKDGWDSNIDVYLNRPEGRRPTPEDTHYAGTFSFFGREHGHDEGMTSEVTITDSIRELQKRKEWKAKELIVTLVRDPLDEKEELKSKLTFEKLTLDGAK